MTDQQPAVTLPRRNSLVQIQPCSSLEDNQIFLYATQTFMSSTTISARVSINKQIREYCNMSLPMLDIIQILSWLTFMEGVFQNIFPSYKNMTQTMVQGTLCGFFSIWKYAGQSHLYISENIKIRDEYRDFFLTNEKTSIEGVKRYKIKGWVTTSIIFYICFSQIYICFLSLILLEVKNNHPNFFLSKVTPQHESW